MLTTGYLHPKYVESLREFGDARFLSNSEGYILERPIIFDGVQVGVDGMGCYPIFACRRWELLDRDFAQFNTRLKSLVIVSDPFGPCDEGELRRFFPDLVRPYKAHFVVDLSQPSGTSISDHHRRNVKKAVHHVTVEHCTRPEEHLDTWVALYDVLIRRHNITGIARFSPAAFAIQLQVPGVVMFRALNAHKAVGMVLWYVQGEVAYYHLAAYTEEGYELRSSYALFSEAISYFASKGLKWLSLGAGAGVEANTSDGLTRFKRGWATGTRTAYLCGRIFDQDAYAALSRKRGSPNTSFFPRYRYASSGGDI